MVWGQQIGVSRTEAADFMRSYFERFPQIKAYMEEMPRRAGTHGYVETLFGRRLATEGIHHPDHVQRGLLGQICGERAYSRFGSGSHSASDGATS